MTVIVLLVLVALIWWLVGRGSGGDTDPAAATTPSSVPPPLTGVLAADTTTPTSSATTPPGNITDFREPDGPTSGHDAVPDSDARTDDTATSGTATGTTGDSESTTSTPDSAETAATTTEKTSDTGEEGSSGTSASASATTTHTATATATVTATTTVTAPASTAPATTVTTTAPPEPSRDAQGRLICPTDSISVKAIGWESTFVAGHQPRIGMSVTNVGDETCMQDVSGARQVYTITTADGDRVWSTDDCFPGQGHAVDQLTPGARANFIIVWAGTTSTPGCDTPRVPVEPGDYTLTPHLGGITGEALEFTMR